MIDPLLDVPPEKAFWFCNGTRALNVYQLVDTIEHTRDEVFYYHVTEDRNDFATWIRDVLEDERLYKLVAHEPHKSWFVEKVRRHISLLESERTEKALNG